MKRKTFFSWILLPVLMCAGAALVPAQTDAAKPVYFRVGVTDGDGQPVGGLRKENFRVTENGVEQEIVDFRLDDGPASVLVLLDVSSSMKPAARAAAALGAAQFIERANAQNDYSIVAFYREIVELAGWQSRRAQLASALSETANLKSETGNTAFLEAVMTALEKLKSAPHEKRILLVFSDGADTASKISFTGVDRALKASGVTVFTVGLLDARDAGSLESLQGQAFLERLTEISGGRSFYPANKKELDDLARKLVLDVERRYLIGYVPKRAASPKDWRAVKIKAATLDAKKKNVEFNVRAREGYYRGGR